VFKEARKRSPKGPLLPPGKRPEEFFKEKGVKGGKRKPEKGSLPSFERKRAKKTGSKMPELIIRGQLNWVRRKNNSYLKSGKPRKGRGGHSLAPGIEKRRIAPTSEMEKEERCRFRKDELLQEEERGWEQIQS